MYTNSDVCFLACFPDQLLDGTKCNLNEVARANLRGRSSCTQIRFQWFYPDLTLGILLLFGSSSFGDLRPSDHAWYFTLDRSLTVFHLTSSVFGTNFCSNGFHNFFSEDEVFRLFLKVDIWSETVICGIILHSKATTLQDLHYTG